MDTWLLVRPPPATYTSPNPSASPECLAPSPPLTFHIPPPATPTSYNPPASPIPNFHIPIFLFLLLVTTLNTYQYLTVVHFLHQTDVIMTML